jgi:hypothetical protein
MEKAAAELPHSKLFLRDLVRDLLVMGKGLYAEDSEDREVTEQTRKGAGLKPGAASDLFDWWAAGGTLRAELAMSAEPARGTIGMTLRQLVDLYLALAGEFGSSVELSAFQLSPAEIVRLFSSYDEDYHISRFFHFAESDGVKFSINGIPATHVSIDPEINSIL